LRRVGIALVAAAAVAAGAVAAPARTTVTIDCRSADRSAATNGWSTGGPNLTLGGQLTIAHFRRLADPVGFRRYRRSGVYRIRATLSVDALSEPTLAGRGPSAVRFAFGPHPVDAAVVTFVPCRDSRISPTMIGPTFFTGEIVVRKAGCYTFAAQFGNDVFRETVPLGVARRC
jgi:hypothetical protein